MINEIYFNKFPQLMTERLLLRKVIPEDAGEIQKIRSNEEVMKYMDSNIHETIQQSEKFIAANLELYERHKGIFWGIIERSSSKFLGDFAYHTIDVKNSRAEIGYTLKPDFWGMGYMKETMNEIFNFGFNALNLHSIEANINPENHNSRKILTRLGFKKEAYFRENYYYKGKFLDSEIYSLLKSDFTGK